MISTSFFKNYYVRRSLSFYIDCIIITFIAFIYLFFFDKKGVELECENFLCWNTVRIIEFQLFFYLIYFLLMEYFFLITLGKKLLGFKLSTDKNKTLFWRILARTLIRIIPINIISFWFDKNYLFWHEKWTKIITTKMDNRSEW